MRSWGLLPLLAALSLTGCAIARPQDRPECAESASFEKGAADAAESREKEFFFPRSCPEDLHSFLLQAYRDGYEAGRTKKQAESRSVASPKMANGYGVPKSKQSWVCEVEAAEKVFTGMGESRAEASEVARNTCSSHIQASYCVKADCKQAM